MSRGDLERLSKDELIELVLKLQRPAKTSRTSSKPPSTDRKERREQSRPGGAKPGHEGHSRIIADEPDAIVDHRPTACPACGLALSSDLPAEAVYRQAEIFAREDVMLETSTLSGWVGASAAALMPLVELLRRDVVAGSDVLHGDDTPVPILAPGTGRTLTGRLWAYVRDERPHDGTRPPAAAYFASPDRKGAHPLAHLAPFSGVLVADGFAGFNGLYGTGRIGEAACWAHVRRKFFDIHAATRSVVAVEALQRIGALYDVECDIRGRPPDERRRHRQARSRPVAEALKAWAETTQPKLSGRSELAAAFRYMLARWAALVRFLDDGRVAIDNNPAERALRGVAVGRKNYLFAGSSRGAERAAHRAVTQGIALKTVKLPEAKRGLVLLPRRWVVERSFA